MKTLGTKTFTTPKLVSFQSKHKPTPTPARSSCRETLTPTNFITTTKPKRRWNSFQVAARDRSTRHEHISNASVYCLDILVEEPYLNSMSSKLMPLTGVKPSLESLCCFTSEIDGRYKRPYPMANFPIARSLHLYS